MIDVSCFTSLDTDKLIRWPKKLVTRPMIGERIASYDNKHTRKIVMITHVTMDRESDGYLQIELSK